MAVDQNNQVVNKLFNEYLSEISSRENSVEYLKSEGFNPDELISDGLRKIRQMKMQIASRNTEEVYFDLTSRLISTARAEASRIMAMTSFDFNSFAKQEGMSLAFRNFESMTQEEIKEFLEKHILLKLQQEEQKRKR